MFAQTNNDVRAHVLFAAGLSGEVSSHLRTELSSKALDDNGDVLDQLISFAFDTLGVRVLDVRVIHDDSP